MGFIKKYVAILDRKKLGIDVVAYCGVSMQKQTAEDLAAFEKAICKYEQIQEVVTTSGTYDYLLKVTAKSIEDYNTFVTNVLANTPNVRNYNSSIVMQELKNETTYKITNEAE
jgi:DNA-binding Lrp family transcriptional regulator